MLSNLDVENVYLYVADAVRWDFAPDDVLNRGTAVKTVAGGIHSPTSIATLVSGTYLSQHHVAQFTDSLPGNVPNLLDASAVSTAFINSINHVRFEPDGTSLIAETLRADERHPDVLSRVDSPFLVIERGPGGHAPYGDFEGDGWEYFEARGGASRSQFAAEYRRAIEEDTDWFQSRLADLERRGLLDETLVVYTSDHGEVLGEYGMLSHSPPIHPAHVFVPTVFVHPAIDTTIVTDRVLRHVDVAPTIASVLSFEGSSPIEPIGRDLTATDLAKCGATFHAARKETPLGTLDVPFDSAWDPTGGYVFPRTDRLRRLLFGAYQLARAPWREYARRNAPAYLYSQLRTDCLRGVPEMTVEEAERYLHRIENREAAQRSGRAGDVPTESLRQLGYIE